MKSTNEPPPAALENVRIGTAMLRQALGLFKGAGAAKTAARVRLAISSAKGAERNAANRDARTRRAGVAS